MQESLPKVELSSTFRATCLAKILAVAGYVTLWNVSCNLSRHNARKVARDISQCNSAFTRLCNRKILLDFQASLSFLTEVMHHWNLIKSNQPIKKGRFIILSFLGNICAFWLVNLIWSNSNYAWLQSSSSGDNKSRVNAMIFGTMLAKLSTFYVLKAGRRATFGSGRNSAKFWRHSAVNQRWNDIWNGSYMNCGYNCVHNCEDHSFTWFHIHSSYTIHFIHHFIVDSSSREH